VTKITRTISNIDRFKEIVSTMKNPSIRYQRKGEVASLEAIAGNGICLYRCVGESDTMMKVYKELSYDGE